MRNFEERGGQIVAGFAPVEARVRDDNFEAADEQGKKAESGDPVGDADKGRVARSRLGGGNGRGGIGDEDGVVHPRDGITCGCEIGIGEVGVE